MSAMDAIKKQLDGVLKGIDKEFGRRGKEPESEWSKLTKEQRDVWWAKEEKEHEEFMKECFGEEKEESPYKGASWGEAENWHCIRCGSPLREVPKDDSAHGKACWSSMKQNGTLDYQCTNKECFHYNAPLTLHHPIGGYKRPAGESYSISWVR